MDHHDPLMPAYFAERESNWGIFFLFLSIDAVFSRKDSRY